ncbi:MAG: hypothetical protein WCK34_06580 [Bacteroidota bacterium]
MKPGKQKSKKGKKENVISVGNAGLASKHGFYLETAWILSLLFEKKAKNVLKIIEADPKTAGYSFEQSINRIKHHHQSGHVRQLTEFLAPALIDEMRTWKNSRNSMLRDMTTIHVSRQRMERLASEGISLYKRWNKSLKIVKNGMKNPGSTTYNPINNPVDEE